MADGANADTVGSKRLRYVLFAITGATAVLVLVKDLQEILHLPPAAGPLVAAGLFWLALSVALVDVILKTGQDSTPAFSRRARTAAVVALIGESIATLVFLLVRIAPRYVVSDRVDRPVLTFSPSDHSRLHGLVKKMRLELGRVLLRQEEGWTQGQIVVAGFPKINVAAPEILASLRTKERECGGNCWRQFGGGKGHRQNAATAWAWMALAMLGTVITSSEAEFMFSQQRDDGSWPTYSDAAGLDYSTVYGTSIVLIAFSKHEAIGFSHPKLRESIVKGISWLKKKSESKLRARWREYPNVTICGEMVSASALAVHALYVHRELDEKIADAWIAALPYEYPQAQTGSLLSPSFAENCPAIVRMTGSEASTRDAIQNYLLPWVLVATADAYSLVDKERRGNALAWLDRYLARWDLSSTEALEPWAKAELALAFAFVAGEERI